MLAINVLPFLYTFILQIAPVAVVGFMIFMFLRNKTIASNNEILEEQIKKKTEQYMALALKYEAILKYVGEGIFTLDVAGKCEFVNETSLRWLGLSEEDVVGKITHNVIHYKKRDGSDYPEKECHLYKMFTEHRYDTNSDQDELAQRGKDFFIKKNGKIIDIEYVATPLFDYNNNYIGAVLVWHPINIPRAKISNIRKKV